MTKLQESASQTAGPYVHIGCVPQTAGLEQRGMGPQLGAKMVGPEAGPSIRLDMSVLDGAGEVVKDALIEIWHASADGTMEAQEGSAHWGRQATDLATGLASFETVKPGAVDGQAPHILVWIAARGINLALTTRIYFPDEDNTQDAVLQLAGARAGTLIAQKTETGYAHSVYLQGPNETVFFDV